MRVSLVILVTDFVKVLPVKDNFQHLLNVDIINDHYNDYQITDMK